MKAFNINAFNQMKEDELTNANLVFLRAKAMRNYSFQRRKERKGIQVRISSRKWMSVVRVIDEKIRKIVAGGKPLQPSYVVRRMKKPRKDGTIFALVNMSVPPGRRPRFPVKCGYGFCEGSMYNPEDFEIVNGYAWHKKAIKESLHHKDEQRALREKVTLQ